MKKGDALIEIYSCVFLDAPVLSESGSTAENLNSECFYENSLAGGIDGRKPDKSRRAELEAIVKDFELLRPHR